MQNLGKMIESAVVEVEDLVLGFSGSDHELSAGTVVIAEEESQRTHVTKVDVERSASVGLFGW